jgi:4-aminobutyrate aminotransferase-like enzyme
LEWVSDRHAKTADPQGADLIVNRLKEKGFLLSRAGILGNVVKIRPPLPFHREHADLFLSAFEETIRETDPSSP